MILTDVILRDTRANQPAATTVPPGSLYFVTDEGVTERSTGSAWQSYSAGAASLALDDLTDVDAPTPSDGDVLTFNNGSGNWEPAAPTGGGGSSPAFVTDSPENYTAVGSEDPADDEFGSTDYSGENALDTSGTRFTSATPWAKRNDGGVAVYTVGDGYMVIKAPATASTSFRIAEQAMPASSTFLIRVKTTINAKPGDQSQVGVCLVNSGASKVAVATLLYSSGWKITGLNYTLPGSFNSDILTGIAWSSMTVWFFIERTSSTSWTFRVSITGLYADSWAIGTVTTSDFIGTPDNLGVCVSSANASIDVYGTFQHWRRLS